MNFGPCPPQMTPSSKHHGSSRAPDPAFQLEAELCRVLATGVRGALKVSDGAPLLSELQVGQVIPDMLLVLADTARLKCKVELSGFESWIVAELLGGRSRRPETLAARLYARPEQTVKALDRLERRGAVYRSTSTTFMLREGWFPRQSEVVAVEAKLARWRDAIEQAKAYLRFANRAYVALPAETINRAGGILDACRLRGIGLLSVSHHGVNIVKKAPLHRTSSPGWVWVVGRVLSDAGLRATQRLRAQGRSAKHADVQALFGHENRPTTIS